MGKEDFRGKATCGPAQDKAIDRAEVRRAFALLADPDGECEVRCLRPNRSAVGLGSDPDGLTAAALGMAHAAAIYLCLNPVSLDAPSSRSASDENVTRRRWLFVDVDSVRKDAKENCATDEEKQGAREGKDALRGHLIAKGWPLPVEVDSGNGYYLLYRIELPNDEDGRTLVRTVLHQWAERITGAKIDRAVHNASRIARLPGTWNRKGRSTSERPHRLCRITGVPEVLTVVTREQLQAEAGGREPPPKHETNGHAGGHPFQGKAGKGGASRLEKYLRQALMNEGYNVAMATRGEHGGDGANNALNEAAFSLGTLLHLGILTETEVIDELTRAANRAGLDVDTGCGPRGIAATIQSGLRAGKAVPRKPPDWINESAPDDADEGPTSPGQKQSSGRQRWQFTFDGEPVAEGEPDEVREAVKDDRDEEGDGVLVRRFEMLTIGALMGTDFPEPEWIVEGIMSEGLDILAGAPKQGKSMLALNLALTVAGGGMALGNVRVNVSDVLYLSLEDKHRRVKTRAAKMLRKIQPSLSVPLSDRLVVATDWPKQDEGGLRMIDLWAKRAVKPGLVIIDVWNRFAPAMKRNANAYAHDAEAMGEVKRFAERRGLTVLVIHHTRKPGLKDPDDFVNEISGTLGLSGSADGILVLMRSRQNAQASLHVTGRDVAEQELVLEFDEHTLTWASLGKKTDHVQGKVQESIVAFLRSNRPNAWFVNDIAEQLDEKANSVRAACNALFLKKVIRKVGNGYAYPGDAFDEPEAEG